MAERDAAVDSRSRLRVLVVARDTELHQLILSALAHAYDLIHERVESAEALHRALQGRQWDVVLCDPALAGRNCREMLSSLLALRNDLAVFVVSDEDDERRAQELLETGVRAVIEASQLGRLVPIVARELKEMREHRLRELQAFLEFSPDPMVIVRADGRIFRVNRLLENLLGYTEAELVGRAVELLVPEARRARHVADRERYVTAPRSRPMGTGVELSARRKDGSEVPVEISLSPFKTQESTFIISLIRDVSERNKATKELRQFRLAMDTSIDSIYLVDLATMRFVDVNDAACRRLDYTREQLLKLSPQDALVADREQLVRLYDEVIAAGGQGTSTEMRYVTRDGRRGWTELHRHAVRSDSGWLIVTLGRDITDRKIAEEARRDSEARFRALTALSSDLYWETDAEHRIIRYSYGAKINPTVPVDEVIGQRRWEIPSVLPDEEGWRAHRATLDAHLPFRDFEIARHGSDGDVHYFSLSGEPVLDADGVFAGYRGVGREITVQKVAEARLDQLAHYDTLTGLPNRALLHDRMRQAMARADRGQTLLAVMFLDLDRFKEINDSLGHEAGDEVLKEAARRLQSCLRSTDTVGRLGGDEFTVLLEDIHLVDEVSTVARKILDAFAEPAEVAGRELHLSTSIGITVYPFDDQDVDTLFKHADMAMYQVKHADRNNFQFFGADVGTRTERSADLRLRLHHALERGEFALHYQPQVHITSGRITGVEALLRWTDAELGPVPPGQFIPVAEEMGLIMPLGDWVLCEACRQCKAWLDAGLGPLRMAVHLSPRQFRQKKLAQRIGEILRETGLPAACLEVEITEGVVMKHTERAIKTLTELNQLGVQIAIDDFGTGYSSLAYLQRFPMHVLKIDQSFVQAIHARSDTPAIVNTVIHLSKLLGLKTLAEGVETVEQLECLRAHGCDAFQGYLFCKPQSAQAIGELLAAHRRERASAPQ